jgi:hypothetical protein
MKLGYMGSYFFIQLVHAGAALGGVIIGVQQIQLWGTGWVRWDDEAQASVGGRALGVGFTARAKANGRCIIGILLLLGTMKFFAKEYTFIMMKVDALGCCSQCVIA